MTTRRYFGAQLHSEDLLRRKGDLAIDKMGGRAESRPSVGSRCAPAPVPARDFLRPEFALSCAKGRAERT